jgi:signal transduction histidine kinase
MNPRRAAFLDESMVRVPIKSNSRAFYMRAQWPVLLLALAVLLPTACVLWLIQEAVRNQGLVVRQKLADVYQSQLSLVRERLDQEWSRKAAVLEDIPGDATAFAQVVKSGLADSAVILASTGEPVYPAVVQPLVVQPLPADPTEARSEWARARQLEERDVKAAASVYIALARTARKPEESARAIQAAARCLVQAGRQKEAARLLVERFVRSGSVQAMDPHGRAVAANALLMAIHLLKPGDPSRLAAAGRLHYLLTDYSHPAIGSAQRIFLMKEMGAQGLPSQWIDFPTLQAEELAVRLLEAEPKFRSKTTVLRSTSLPGMWALASSKRRVLALFRTKTILARTHEFLAQLNLPAGVRLEIAPPGDKQSLNSVLLTASAGDQMPGWQLALVSTGPDPFKDLANRQLTLYLWIGLLVTAAVVVLALIAGRLISRSLRLAGLKADLVAVVSHELKTPLSSMRLLVDTLLDDSVLDHQKTREYLALIASENARLSLLIENFLAFSRMERNKYSLQFAPVAVEDVVEEAVKASGQRFDAPGCQLHVEIMPGLPAIRADQGALAAALVNLLDNAYKYTPDKKRISLRAFRAGHSVYFEVCDNGIGIPARETKKIFQKFYQADLRLSRTGGGCGLGLSIVSFLVEAHGGTVRVSSEPGKGSTFTVALEILA